MWATRSATFQGVKKWSAPQTSPYPKPSRHSTLQNQTPSPHPPTPPHLASTSRPSCVHRQSPRHSHRPLLSTPQQNARPLTPSADANVPPSHSPPAPQPTKLRAVRRRVSQSDNSAGLWRECLSPILGPLRLFLPVRPQRQCERPTRSTLGAHGSYWQTTAPRPRPDSSTRRSVR